MHKLTLNKLLFIPLLTGLSLTACAPDRVYTKIKDIENTVWNKNDVIEFTFQINDADLEYSLNCLLRNGVAYPYTNIYLNFELLDAEGNQLWEELRTFDLFDPKTGKPYGDGLGDLFDHEFALKDSYRFPGPGQYKITIAQFMRMDNLPMVMAVGLEVDESEPKSN